MKNNSENAVSLENKIEKCYLSLLKEALAAASLEWEKPWLRSIVNFSPQGFDGNLYSGSNRFFLSLVDAVKGYSTPIHVTVARANKEGFYINKGEHGDTVIKYCPYYLPNEEGKAMGLKYASEQDYQKMSEELKVYYHEVGKIVGFTVFNIEQTNIKEVNPELYDKMLDRFTKIEGERDNTLRTSIAALDQTIKDNSWICPIQNDSVGQAYWNSKANFIKIPDKMGFRNDVSFYRTLIHEMIHSTSVLPKKGLTEGEKQILQSSDTTPEKRAELVATFKEPIRQLNYGNIEGRAREEMVADLGAAMVMTQIGIDATFSDENKAYLQNWYQYLGLKESEGNVLNPEIRKFGTRLEDSGWIGNVRKMAEEVVQLGKGNPLDNILEEFRIPKSTENITFLEQLRDGHMPLMVKGTTLVEMNDIEREKIGVKNDALSSIVKDAWRAAKIVLSDAIKIDLKRELKQGEDFSIINDKKVDESMEKAKKWRSSASKSRCSSSETTKTRRYGRR